MVMVNLLPHQFPLFLINKKKREIRGNIQEGDLWWVERSSHGVLALLHFAQ